MMLITFLMFLRLALFCARGIVTHNTALTFCIKQCLGKTFYHYSIILRYDRHKGQVGHVVPVHL